MFFTIKDSGVPAIDSREVMGGVQRHGNAGAREDEAPLHVVLLRSAQRAAVSRPAPEEQRHLRDVAEAHRPQRRRKGYAAHPLHAPDRPSQSPL